MRSIRNSSVYAAYDDYLLVWNARDGTLTGKVKMPTVDEMLQQAGASPTYSRYYYYNRPTIKSLVLDGDLLLVVVDGYDEVAETLADIKYPILSGTTHLRVYDKSEVATGGQKVLGTSDVRGSFNELRLIEGSNAAHVMAVSNVDTYRHLERPFDRNNHPFFMMTDDEYAAAARSYANSTAIPAFVDNLVKELTTDNGATLPVLAKICL